MPTDIAITVKKSGKTFTASIPALGLSASGVTPARAILTVKQTAIPILEAALRELRLIDYDELETPSLYEDEKVLASALNTNRV